MNKKRRAIVYFGREAIGYIREEAICGIFPPSGWSGTWQSWVLGFKSDTASNFVQCKYF